MDFYQQLQTHQVWNQDELQIQREALELVEAHRNAAFGSEIAGEIGHLTSAAWILNHDATKVLLVFGAKESRWKLPGGHVESEREIWNVAYQQALCASGDADVNGSEKIFALTEITVPEYWNTPAHQHFEIVWGFIAEETADLSPGAKWFLISEAAELEKGAFLRLIERPQTVT